MSSSKPEGALSTPDLSFSSSGEIKSFVRANMGFPGYSIDDVTQLGGSSYFRKNFSGKFTDLNGQNVLSNTSTLNKVHSIFFRTMLNPLDFDGSFIREM